MLMFGQIAAVAFR